MDKWDKEIQRGNQVLAAKRGELQATKPQPISKKIETTLPEKLSALPDDDRAAEFAWTCLDCLALVEPFAWTFGNKTRYIRREFCDCVAGRILQAAREKDIADDEREACSEQLIFRSGLNAPEYHRFRFDTWDKQRNAPWSGKAADNVGCYVDQVKAFSGNWLYLHGNYGLGKTHLAIAALRKIAAIRLWEPHIVVWPELCQATKESWDRGSGSVTEAHLWGPVKRAKILLIDDLDKTPTAEWAMGKLFVLINERSMKGKPTIITANHSVTDLQAKWSASRKPHVNDTGMAVLSRIIGELWGLVEFKGSDQRMA